MFSLVILGGERLWGEIFTAALSLDPQLSRCRWVSTINDLEPAAAQGEHGVLITVLPTSADDLDSVITRATGMLPGWMILAFGGDYDEETVVGMIEAGACAYLPSGTSLAHLTAAIKSTYEGTMSHPPRLVSLVVARLRHLSSGGRVIQRNNYNLTKREREVVYLMSHGLANKDIARHLGVSTSTAKNHVHALLRKLNANRRRDAIVKAYEAELLTDIDEFPVNTEQ